MYGVAFLAAGVGVFLLYSWWRGRAMRGAGFHHVVLFWNGAVFSFSPCTPCPEGIRTPDGVISTPGMYALYQWVDIKPAVRVYLVADDAIALANHRALEAARSTVILSALFKSGGELLRYLQYAAIVIPLMLFFLMYSTVATLQTQVNALSGNDAIWL